VRATEAARGKGLEEEEEEKRPTEGAFLSIEMNVGRKDDVR